jgi:hypothetical protein
MLRPLMPVVAAFAFVALACVSEDPGLKAPDKLTCDVYCNEVMSRCTGPQAQYLDPLECKRVCDILDAAGSMGQRTDNEGLDTIGCRYNRARDTTPNCVAAGPYGGGVCGATRCAAFCKIQQSACATADNKPFDTEEQCVEECPSIPVDPEEPEFPPSAATGSDSIQCRGRHLILAITQPNPHCGHAALLSDTCK